MSHARKQIRDAVCGLLSAASTAWKVVIPSRVEPSRPLWPYLLVFSDRDTVEAMTVQSPSPLARELTLHVVGMQKMPGNSDTISVEDAMDEMASAIEDAMTSEALRESLPNSRLTLGTTEMHVMVTDDDKIDHAEVTMTYTVNYYTMEGDSSVFI